ncbi:MAG: hypothetical protein U0T56_09905 [Ferruginibacter sp.]
MASVGRYPTADGNTAQQGRDFELRLGETEILSTEEEDIIPPDIPPMLSRKYWQWSDHSGPHGRGLRGFVHLTEYEGGL